MEKFKNFEKYLKEKFNYKKKVSINLINCEVCNKKNFDVITNKSLLSSKKNLYVYFPYSLCENCGHAQQIFRLNKDFYNNYYNKVLTQNTSRNKKYPERLKNTITRGKILLKLLEQKLNLRFKNQKVLDIGCGHGGMLLEFHQKKCQVVGIDPDKNALNFSKKKYPYLNLINQSAEKMNFKKNSFDLIIINGSLEHVYDVNMVMKKVGKYLKKNGYLFLEGKGYPLDKKENYFNFSHHRLFTKNSFSNLCAKYQIFKLTTSYKSPLNIHKMKFASLSHKNFAQMANSKGNLYWIGQKKKLKKYKMIKDTFFKKFFK